MNKDDVARVDEKPPRRRIAAKIEIEADSWRELRVALRQLETKMVEDGGKLHSHVSGGYSSGWIVTANEDESITHETWERDLDAHLQKDQSDD